MPSLCPARALPACALLLLGGAYAWRPPSPPPPPPPPPPFHWSQAWATAGLSTLLLAGPVRRVGVPSLLRLARATLSPTERALGASIFAAFSLSRGRLLVSRAAPAVVARALVLNASSPLHHRLLAPLCGLGVLPLTARSATLAAALPAVVLAARAAYSLLPFPYKEMVFCSAMFGGLTPFAAAISVEAAQRLAPPS
ncbi:hypothetical protein AB1Y20_005608 [Prymnesium parvum]|uniref:Mannosyltransferase n=1 Tax=Prymnesium parvum TaxID=97485 RepID=A0AB34J6T8_PRYPA